ncbi:MAG: hypothetical protein ACM33T_16270 [Solirubrobacterales bacterium]
MRAWVLTAGLALSAAVAVAQEPAVDGWTKRLERQMREEEACTVAFLGEVIERKSPYMVRAKVNCQDQRVFTVEQHGGPEQPFRVVACNREGPSC